MADNPQTQSATPATLPESTRVAAIVGAFAGDTDATAGLGILAEATGAEGSRVLTVFGVVDSGIVSVPTGSLTAVTNFGVATAYRLDCLHFVNVTGAAITVGVSDGSGAYIVPTQDVPARGHLTIPLYGLPYTGLKWVAGASGLTGKAFGRTAI
jgi:hypothetical protein